MIHIEPITAEEQRDIFEKKIDERFKYNLLHLETNENFAANQTLLWQMCADDWKFFVNNFVWIQDPEADKLEEKVIPFMLWDFQEKAGDEIVKAVIEGYDLPIDKCRKVGATWLVEAILLWGWNFHEWEVLCGSRKFEEVDRKGDMGTLFQKVRFMLEKLPKFLFPKNLDHFTDKVGMIIHPLHKASIAGEGNSPDFGRSDRRKVAFLDEFTSWEQTDRAAWQGLSATTKCRIPVSTPNRRGVNCFFYQIIQDHRKKNKPYLHINWELHPVFSKGMRDATESDLAYIHFALPRTSAWLENEIHRATDMESVAQEILINYEASMSGKVFGEFSYESQVFDDVEYDENLPLYVAWDFGLDATAMLFIQPDIKNRTLNIIDEYQNDGSRNGDNIYHYLDVLDAKGYKKAIHFGDPQSGENRSLTSGQSPANIMRKNGIIFKCDRTRIINRIKAGRNLLSQVRINSKCTLVTEMFTSWQLRKPKSGNSSGQLPDHSPYSHIGEAYTYFCWNFAGMKERTKEKNKKIYIQGFGGVT